MVVAKLRYKGYSFEHNPKELVITNGDELNEQVIMRSESIVNYIGSKARIVKGTGQIVGEDCISKFADLLKLKGDSGILSLPDTLPFYAYLKTLELACDPTPKVITYNFQFVEDLSRKPVQLDNIYHLVENDETLWDIAYSCNVDIDTLVKLNPNIKRIDELETGAKIRIC